MPYRRKRRRSRKKRTYGRRRTKRRRKNKYRAGPTIKTVRGLGTLIPDILRVKLRYSDTKIFSTLGAGLLNNYVYRANSLQDTDFTGIGHQPYGFDQMSTWYSRYLVYGSKIQLKMINNSTLVDLVTVVLYPQLSASPQTNSVDSLEAPFSVNRIMGSDAEKAYIKNYMTTKKMYGVRRLEDDDGADVTANPVNPWYWIIGVFDHAGNSATITYSLQISFYVEFSSRQRLVGS